MTVAKPWVGRACPSRTAVCEAPPISYVVRLWVPGDGFRPNSVRSCQPSRTDTRYLPDVFAVSLPSLNQTLGSPAIGDKYVDQFTTERAADRFKLPFAAGNAHRALDFAQLF